MHPLGGVGRHAAEVIRNLAATPGTDVELFASRQWLDAEGNIGSDSALPRLLAERCWKTLGVPRVDRWVEGADWLYSPMETYLPTKRVPVAVTIHDVQAFETNLPWSGTPHHLRWRTKWNVWIHKVLRDCRVVFTVSEFTKSRMVELLGADSERVVVVGNGVGREFFAIKKDDPTTEAYAIVVGGLRRKKGGAEVIAVARELGARRASLRVLVAGISDTDLVKEARGVTNLEVLGTVSEPELHRLMGGASSLLFLSSYEGFGLPALEAMAAGVPVVAANRAALPEAVGDAGILLEPSASEEIADTLIELNRDPSRRASLVAAGCRRAGHFTWDRCAVKVIQTLSERN